MKEFIRWRTAIVVAFLAILVLVALWMCRGLPEKIAIELFGTAAWVFVGFAAIAAGKSLGEHLAGGGGVKGAIAALLTDAKPDPAPARAPEPKA